MANNLKYEKKVLNIEQKNFAQEIKVFLNKYQITQKELSLRLHLSIKHINSILNNEIKRISASVLDNLEYVLKLPFGSLTRLYHEHIALNEVQNIPNVEQQLREYGIDYISDHPELFLRYGVLIEKNMPLYKKMMQMKKFYGVSILSDYFKYLDVHALADATKYTQRPNSIVWIRLCENCINFENLYIGTFRKNGFELCFKKVLNYMNSNEYSIFERLEKIKEFLYSKGIVLVLKPFIENSYIKSITIKKGGKRYIFLSDMLNTEPLIFFALLHELVHCYFPNFNEEQIDKKVISQYRKWEKNHKSNYKAIYDAINYINVVAPWSENEKNGKPLDEITKQHLLSLLQKNYEYVTFEDKTYDENNECEEKLNDSTKKIML